MSCKKMVFTTLFFSFLYCVLFAQETPEEKRIIEEEKRKELEELPKKPITLQDFDFDYGAWFRWSFTNLETAEETRNLRSYDLRLWTDISYKGLHRVYLRILNLYKDWNKNDSPDGPSRDEDFVGPNLDIGVYQLNITKLLAPSEDAISPIDIKFTGGRQYLVVGTGLVLNTVLDSVKFDIDTPYISADLFWGKSIASRSNIDVSVPGFTSSRREFTGAEVTLNILSDHKPYLFYVRQRDFSSERPEDESFEFDYDSNYLGIGSRGEIINDLHYTAEYVKQTGKSHPFVMLDIPVPIILPNNGITESINSHAFLVGLDYYFKKCPATPKLSFNFVSTEGDKDRISPTTTMFGNRFNTDDTGFLGFGFINTGYSLSPNPTNLVYWNPSITLKPLEWTNNDLFKNLEAGISYYRFRKEESESRISDLFSSEDSKDIGKEWDIFVNWRVFSDLSVYLRAGRFYPGSAYPDDLDDTRDFLYFGVSYSF